MNAINPPQGPPSRFRVDLALVGIGAGLLVLVALETLLRAPGAFGDGITAGVGAMALGAGIRGLIAQS